MRRGENRKKAGRFVYRDDNIWIGKSKLVHTSKAKRGINSLLPISRQISSCFLESRAGTCMAVAWEDKHHNHECPLFLLCSLSNHC